jgi:hypothetical protein
MHQERGDAAHSKRFTQFGNPSNPFASLLLCGFALSTSPDESDG